MQKIVVVDYGMGNLRSVAKAFEFVAREHFTDIDVSISSSPQQVLDAVGHRALPGKYHPICIENLLRRAADADVDIREMLTRNELKGLCHRAQIAHPVINHYYFLHATPEIENYRAPLVDGRMPAARGSSSQPMRSARPKALKTVSIW